MKKVYSLKSDIRFIEDVQKATLETKKFGIVSENGLFGSNEWWQAIENGEIKTYVLEGVISDVYMSGHNDFPEFKILSSGNTSSWERRGDIDLYKKGKAVKMEYVLTKNRYDHKTDQTQLNVWLET